RCGRLFAGLLAPAQRTNEGGARATVLGSIEVDLLGQVRRPLLVLGRLRQLLLQGSIQLAQLRLAQRLERFGLVAGVLENLQKLARKLERAPSFLLPVLREGGGSLILPNPHRVADEQPPPHRQVAPQLSRRLGEGIDASRRRED